MRGILRRQPGTADAARDRGGPTRDDETPYNRRSLIDRNTPLMEAESINRIAATLADLKTRTAELRRYL